jgi:hypothetical protein
MLKIVTARASLYRRAYRNINLNGFTGFLLCPLSHIPPNPLMGFHLLFGRIKVSNPGNFCHFGPA